MELFLFPKYFIVDSITDVKLNFNRLHFMLVSKKNKWIISALSLNFTKISQLIYRKIELVAHFHKLITKYDFIRGGWSRLTKYF